MDNEVIKKLPLTHFGQSLDAQLYIFGNIFLQILIGQRNLKTYVLRKIFLIIAYRYQIKKSKSDITLRYEVEPTFLSN